MDQERVKEIFFQPQQELDDIRLRLAPFDLPEWETCPGAGGSEGLKDWVRKMSAGEEGAFEECCAQISHQMTFYPAIYLVFPYLVEKLASDFDRMDAQKKIMYISQLGMCLMTDCDMLRQEGLVPDGAVLEDPVLRRLYGSDRMPPGKEVLEMYESGISGFQLVIRHFLSKEHEALSRADSMTRTVFALAVLAAFGNREDAFLFMNAEMDGCIYTVCGACEACDEDTLDLSDENALSAIRPRERSEEGQDGEDLQDTFSWFGAFLELIQDKRLAGHLPYYLGAYDCPECGAEAVVRDLMRNYMAMDGPI